MNILCMALSVVSGIDLELALCGEKFSSANTHSFIKPAEQILRDLLVMSNIEAIEITFESQHRKSALNPLTANDSYGAGGR